MFVPIQIPAGVVRGASTDDFPGRWYDTNLVRWVEGQLLPVGGWAKVTNTPFTGPARRLFRWRDNSNISWTLVATDQKLLSLIGSAFDDITPSGFVTLDSVTSGGYGAGAYGASTYGTNRAGFTSTTPRKPMWSLSNWGEDVIACASTDGRLLYADATDLTVAVKPVGQISLLSVHRVSGTTTATTTTPHGLATGDRADVTGVTDTGFNMSNVLVTVLDSTGFTYTNAGGDATSSGGSILNRSVPISNRAVLVTAERHVMAIGVSGNPTWVGWSSREDYLDWHFASVTNTAGYIPLKTNTALQAMCQVREGVIVWSEDQVFIVRYVGEPFIYGSDTLGESSLYSPYAYAEISGRCVFMDRSGFKLYDGGAITSLPCPLNDYIFSTIDPLYGPRLVHASNNGLFKEVWFFFPSAGLGYCDKYVIWNWAENWWAIGSLDRSAMIPSTGANDYPLATPAHLSVTNPSTLLMHENGWDHSNNVFSRSQIDVYAESAVMNLPGAEQTMHITQVIPSIGPDDYQNITLTFYSRMTPNGAERTFGPYNVRSDGYLDCRVSGRDVRVRIDGRAKTKFSVGRMRFNVHSGGRR